MTDFSAADETVHFRAGEYAVHVGDFEGPLHLLLSLIQRNEYDIADLPIGPLTQAYLETLGQLDALGLEPVSEFLAMASTLLVLKSRMLLPRAPADHEENAEFDDPRSELVAQLLAYQQIQDAADKLANQDRMGFDFFTRPPGLDRPRDAKRDLAGVQVIRLAQAFKKMMTSQSYRAPHDIFVERVSIHERIAQVGRFLQIKGRTSFASLILESETREEVITTFLALLEMARLHLVSVTQRSLNSPLYVQGKGPDVAGASEEAAGLLAEH